MHARKQYRLLTVDIVTHTLPGITVLCAMKCHFISSLEAILLGRPTMYFDITCMTGIPCSCTRHERGEY